MRLLPLTSALLTLPVSVQAADYLSVEAAQKLMFPAADSFVVQDVLMDAALVQKLKAPAVSALAQGHLRLVSARLGAQALGLVVVDEVIGKYERIRFAVGINADGTVRQVEILSYRESHGGEVRLPAWRKQFAGKRATAALQVGEDIANISGATLSCSHITDGVRRIVTAVAALQAAGKLA